MGVVNHNAIIATTWNVSCADRMWDWINDESRTTWRPMFTRTDSIINRYCTIFMAPDGSKEGWDESDYGDRLRDEFIAELSKDGYEDGSSPWSWVEVGFGEYGQKLLRGNNRNMYSDSEYEVG